MKEMKCNGSEKCTFDSKIEKIIPRKHETDLVYRG